MSDFREQVAATVPRLRAFACTLAAGDRPLADDLLQDTIVLALRAQDQFTPGTNLGAWLHTILRNRFRSMVARKHVKAEVPPPEGGLDEAWWTPPAQEAALEVRAFRQAFRRLGPHHREVLVLIAVEGLPYERAAELCGCEVGTVKSRVNRARRLLKRMLLDEGAGDLPTETPAPSRRGRPPGCPRSAIEWRRSADPSRADGGPPRPTGTSREPPPGGHPRGSGRSRSSWSRTTA